MMAAGHSVPTCYALWMILGQALYRKYQQTGDPRYHVDPHDAMLAIDALGFRRGAGALKTLLRETIWKTIRCSRKPKAAAFVRSRDMPKAPTSPTT